MPCSSHFVTFVNTGEEAVTAVLGHGEGEAELGGRRPRAGPEGWTAGCLVSLTLPALGEHLPAFPCVATGGQWSQGCRRQAVLGGGRAGLRDPLSFLFRRLIVSALRRPLPLRAVYSLAFSENTPRRGAPPSPCSSG